MGNISWSKDFAKRKHYVHSLFLEIKTVLELNFTVTPTNLRYNWLQYKYMYCQKEMLHEKQDLIIKENNMCFFYKPYFDIYEWLLKS